MATSTIQQNFGVVLSFFVCTFPVFSVCSCCLMMNRVKSINLSVFHSYKQIVGDLKIKCKFVVPLTKPWPEEFHGMKLGNYVKNFRANLKKSDSYYDPEDVKQLLSMGFISDVHKEQNRITLSGFTQYKQHFGYCEVVKSFKIPKDDESWSEEVRGMNLGHILDHIRNDDDHKEIHDKLTALGVDIGPQNAGHDFERTFVSLTAFRKVHKHVKVPRNFVVPENDSNYPENTWNVNLGTVLHTIRIDGGFSEHKDRLIALGVDFNVKEINVVGFDVIHSALKVYKEIHGNLKMKTSFVVPENDERYPKETHGLKLGSRVRNIRYHGAYPEHREQLEALGFHFKVPKIESFDVIYSALKAYKVLHGDLKIRRFFVIPENDERYPKEAHGLKLGHRLLRIRNNGTYVEHREQLEALGIVFKK